MEGLRSHHQTDNITHMMKNSEQYLRVEGNWQGFNSNRVCCKIRERQDQLSIL